MALVEYDEAEAVAEALHMQVGRVVGGDGDVVHHVRAAAHEADVDGERRREAVVPLRHQVEGGHHDQGAALLHRHRQRCHEGLARAGGQHHHAAATGFRPRADGFGLVREGRAHGARLQIRLGVRARVVEQLDAAALQRVQERAVVERLCPKHVFALVPQERQLFRMFFR
jgi:hypothetical protein